MSERLDRIVARREELVRQAEDQRVQLASEAAEIQRSLWYVEPVARTVRAVTSRPLLFFAVAGMAIALGPRRLLRGGSRVALLAISVLRLGRVFRALF